MDIIIRHLEGDNKMFYLFEGAVFIIIGTITIIYTPKLIMYKKKDYSKFPVTTATIGHMHDFTGDRWIVHFKNEKGIEVLGMDDVISYSTFFPDKYHIPKFGQQEEVYYWEYEGKSNYRISKQRVEYYIHFCNEDLYELQKIKGKNHSIIAVIIGLAFIICGILIATRPFH